MGSSCMPVERIQLETALIRWASSRRFSSASSSAASLSAMARFYGNADALGCSPRQAQPGLEGLFLSVLCRTGSRRRGSRETVPRTYPSGCGPGLHCRTLPQRDFEPVGIGTRGQDVSLSTAFPISKGPGRPVSRILLYPVIHLRDVPCGTSRAPLGGAAPTSPGAP